MTLVFVNEDPTFVTPSVTTGKCMYYDVTSDATRRCRGGCRGGRGGRGWVLPEPTHGRAGSGGDAMPSNRQQVRVCGCGVSSARKHTLKCMWDRGGLGPRRGAGGRGRLPSLWVFRELCCCSEAGIEAHVPQRRPAHGRVMPGSKQVRGWGRVCFSHTRNGSFS